MHIHKEGIKTILSTLILSVAICVILLHFCHFSTLAWVISSIVIIFTLFILTFFRVPDRVHNGSGNLISAPADGKIVIIKEVEENEYFKGKAIQVSVFMTFFNVHVNWYPVSGEIVYYKYHPGKYVAAFYSKSSEKNERTTVVIKNDDGKEVLCRQIAGLFARRVVCYASKGKRISAGDEEGFIKFGSRADVFLPLDAVIKVKLGDKVIGGESILAEI